MTKTDQSGTVRSSGASQRRTPLPPRFPTAAIREQLLSVRDYQAETREARDRYLDLLGEGDLEVTREAWQNYQQAALGQRHAEGEVLWGALGYAIMDIAANAAPDDEVTENWGESLISWAIDADTLETVTDTYRIQIEVARLFPTLPESHVPYVETMLELGADEFAGLRERDQITESTIPPSAPR